MSAAALRAALAAASRRFAPLDLGHGRAGNLSARLARAGREGCLITPTGAEASRLLARDLCWLPLAGDPDLPVRGRTPSSEWRLHRDLYLARPEVAAIVHTHSPAATALACLPGGLPAFHYGVAVAGGRDIRCADYATFGTQALSEHALRALDGRRACLLAHHGVIATGATIEAALELAREVESLARIYLLARQAGEPARLSDAEMDRVLERYRTYGQPARSGR